MWRCTSTVTGEEAGWGAGWRDGGLELCACGLRTAGYLSSHSYGLDGVLLPGIVLGNQAAALDLPTYLLPEAQKRMQPVAARLTSRIISTTQARIWRTSSPGGPA